VSRIPFRHNIGIAFAPVSAPEADLVEANLSGAALGRTVFGATRLSEVKGLDRCRHTGPSIVDFQTLKNSGPLPIAFLRGVGLPDNLIEYLPSLLNKAIQFYSCFISYSHQDEPFARKLWSRMRQERIRVWFAREEMQGGKKLFDQIERAIHMHDKLLLVLSETSIKSNWVETEIRKARQQELKEGQRKLFPIRLIDMKTLQSWRCPDADSGRDLAVDVREYFVPDFSKWLHDPSFDKAFLRLRQDLRREVVSSTR
jgi:hypothetical protein